MTLSALALGAVTFFLISGHKAFKFGEPVIILIKNRNAPGSLIVSRCSFLHSYLPDYKLVLCILLNISRDLRQ